MNLDAAVGRELEKQNLTIGFRNTHKVNLSKGRCLPQTMLIASALLFLFLPQIIA